MKKSMARRRMLAPQISIGLDLGGEEAVACVVDRGGEVLSLETVAMTPAGVRELFEGLERATIVLEATGQSGWVARLLEEIGHDVLVCNPRRLKLIAASTLKTDKLDAELLGRLARVAQMDPELFRPVTVRSRRTQLLRSEMKGRDQLISCRKKLISSVRSVLRSDALPTPKCDADRFAARLDLGKLPEDVRIIVEPQVAIIASLTEQLVAIERRLCAVAAEFPVASRLMQIDGVGLITSLSFILCLEEPGRFAKSRDVGAYLGLVPRLRQSCDQEFRGRITKQGDASLRRVLVQAALGQLRAKRESALKQWALAVVERRGRKKAVVALARKLAVVMHHIWLTGEDYVTFPGRPPAVTQAERLASVA